jgi:hypothetical protein
MEYGNVHKLFKGYQRRLASFGSVITAPPLDSFRSLHTANSAGAAG